MKFPHSTLLGPPLTYEVVIQYREDGAVSCSTCAWDGGQMPTELVRDLCAFVATTFDPITRQREAQGTRHLLAVEPVWRL